jgi:hypothetical protein
MELAAEFKHERHGDIVALGEGANRRYSGARMTDSAFRVAVAVAAMALAGAIARISFCRGGELPAIPARPRAKPVPVATVTAAVEADPGVYAEQLARDSRVLRVEPPATPADMARALVFESHEQPIVLVPKGKSGTSAEVLGLRLSLAVTPIEGTPRRQMVLTIENTSDAYLAYRVVSRPSQGTRPCHDKLDLAHNAIALAPGEKIRRSECIYRSGYRLFVNRVETAVLPKLSYYYVSSLPPSALSLDLLSSRGHRPIGGRQLCRVFQSAALEEAVRTGQTTWRDLVDFYARHACQTFTFPPGYTAFSRDGERPLPAVAAGP